jgi:hypothetical protein
MGVAVSEETLLNDEIRTIGSDTHVGHMADGGWVVTSREGQNRFVAQRYAADGTQIGDEILLATKARLGYSYIGDIYAMSSGGWIESFANLETVDGKSEYYFHLVQYGAHGNLISHLVEKNDTYQKLTKLTNDGYIIFSSEAVTDYIFNLTATIYDSAGNEIVQKTLGHTNALQSWPMSFFEDGAWSIYLSDEGEYGTYRLYDASGNLLNSVDGVSDGTVLFNADGSYSITHTNLDQDAGEVRKSIEFFDSAGTLLDTAEPPPYDYSDYYTYETSFSLSDGSRIFLWRDFVYQQPGLMHLRVVDAQGELTVEDTVIGEVNPYFSDSSVLELSTGGWVVFWNGYQQVFNPDGTKHGAANVIFPGSIQAYATDDGGWVVVYNDDTDGGDHSSVYTRTFHPNDINNAPIPLVGGAGATEDHLYHFGEHNFATYDPDGDKIKSIVIESLPTTGQLTFDGTEVTIGQIVELADLSKLTWMPEQDASGSDVDSFLFNIIDENGAISESPATLSLDIVGLNDAPWSADKTITILEDQKIRLRAEDFPFFDIDGDTIWGVNVTPQENRGEFFVSYRGIHHKTFAYLTGNDPDRIFYTPAKNEYGGDYEHFTIKVLDDGERNIGDHNTEVGNHTLTFNVLPVNDAPVAENTAMWMNEGQKLRFIDQYFYISDVENDRLKSIIIDELPEFGTLRLGTKTVKSGDEIDIADTDKLSFELGDHEAAANKAMFTFFARDNGGTKNGGIDIDEHANNFSFKISSRAGVIQGTAERDILNGSEKTDILDGGAGNDVLYGGQGDDRLYGGTGADRFLFRHRGGEDTIFDFDVESDVIDARGSELKSFDDIKSHHTQYSEHLLAFGYMYLHKGKWVDASMFLTDVDFNDLTEKNFIF